MVQRYSIGRNPDNQIVVNCPMVSGYHADIVVNSANGYSQYTYTDHSTNGTWINGQLLHNASCLVAYGDMIVFPGNIAFDWNVLNSANFVVPHSESIIQSPNVRYDQDFSARDKRKAECVEEDITFFGALKKFFNHYADFSGRSRRREYWFMYLWDLIFSSAYISLMLIFALLVGYGGFEDVVELLAGGAVGLVILSILYGIFILSTIIPYLALTVRRIHDIGKPGWWLFLSFIPLAGFVFVLIWSFGDSERKENEWGPCPKKN